MASYGACFHHYFTKFNPPVKEKKFKELKVSLAPPIDKLGAGLAFAFQLWRTKAAEKLKKEVFEKEKLTCTVGIGPNKLIAKMTAEKAKSKTSKEPTNNIEILKKEAKKLLLKFLVENLKLIRLIGLRISF